jgi:hypothetical protein
VPSAHTQLVALEVVHCEYASTQNNEAIKIEKKIRMIEK